MSPSYRFNAFELGRTPSLSPAVDDGGATHFGWPQQAAPRPQDSSSAFATAMASIANVQHNYPLVHGQQPAPNPLFHFLGPVPLMQNPSHQYFDMGDMDASNAFNFNGLMVRFAVDGGHFVYTDEICPGTTCS